MRRLPPLLLVLLLVAGACGDDGGSGEGGAITGRVMSVTPDRYCVSDDRGASQTCEEVRDPARLEGVEVGACVESTPAEVEVVDDAACAAGDVGDGGD
jgi:hypothetical protein